MIQTTGNILSVVLVFGALIFFHELGHYLVARFFAIGVKTFSLGFGPKLFSFKRGSTVYQVAAIPLGGYVSIVGESANAEIPEPFSKEESFSLRPAWQRFLVIAAGSVFNFFLAIIILWGLIFFHGRAESANVIAEVSRDMPAEQAGLQPGDRILGVNGAKITTFNQVLLRLYENGNNPVAMKIEREGQEPFEVTMSPVKIEEKGPNGSMIERWIVGIVAPMPTVEYPSFLASGGAAIKSAGHMLVSTWKGLSGLVSKKIGFENVSGPVGITQVMYQQANQGLVPLLLLAALISVNLGFLNLLPIPVLDGGHLLFLLVEMVFRRPVPTGIQEKAMLAGLAMLLSLMLFATFNDVTRIAKSNRPAEQTQEAQSSDRP